MDRRQGMKRVGEKRGKGSRLQESNLTLHPNMECSSTSAPTKPQNEPFMKGHQLSNMHAMVECIVDF
jgi:hypothetical protein